MMMRGLRCPRLDCAFDLEFVPTLALWHHTIQGLTQLVWWQSLLGQADTRHELWVEYARGRLEDDVRVSMVVRAPGALP